jgi:branched-chain amino acid transport system substrate-binding protein
MRTRIAGRVLGCFLLVLMVGCEREKPPVKVGFVGGLTGRFSDLGTAGRNGVMLAVEEVNSAGGMGGRTVELITKDDRQDPKTATEVDKALIQEGVVAIIGHMTSAMSIAAVPLINAEKVLMISPTTSTGQLTGKDDWFLRTMVPTGDLPRKLAEYAHDGLGPDRMAAIYDLANRAYAEDKERFVARFGAEPSFAAIFGYEAARVLFEALSKSSDPRTLKETILKQKKFQGVQGDFEMDEYGDARRGFFLITVLQGGFKTME